MDPKHTVRSFRRVSLAILAVLSFRFIFTNLLSSIVLAGEPGFADRRGTLEKETLELINHDRIASDYLGETRGRARPLLWDDRLARVARAHSEEMARNGYFSHQSASGQSPADRLSAAGILWTHVGENIANCETVTQAESTFMDEPRFERNHRWNILNPNYTRVGVGIARGDDGMLHITEDFAQLR